MHTATIDAAVDRTGTIVVALRVVGAADELMSAIPLLADIRRARVAVVALGVGTTANERTTANAIDTDFIRAVIAIIAIGVVTAAPWYAGLESVATPVFDTDVSRTGVVIVALRVR
jgi:hypothetical protein